VEVQGGDEVTLREVEARGYGVPEEAWVVRRAEILEDLRGRGEGG